MQKLSMFPGISDPEMSRQDEPQSPIQVRKSTQERRESVNEPLVADRIDVEHVIKNERVDGPLPMREEGDTVVIPVVKQVLRIEKEWVLAEEVRVTRRREEYVAHEDMSLQEEEAEIFDGEGWRVHEPRERGILGGRLPIFKGKLAS